MPTRHGRQLHHGLIQEDGSININLYQNQFDPDTQTGSNRLQEEPVYQLPVPSAFKRFRPREKVHISFLAGIRILQPDRDPEKYSGYQVMRLATELVPTYSAILGRLIVFLAD